MRNIPAITKNLLIINILAFMATWLLQRYGIDLNSLGGLHFFLAPDFNVVQLVTYMFLHGGFTHILFNMFALWMFGCVLERVWGPRKFLFYYLACGIGAGLMQELAQFIRFYTIIDGASVLQMAEMYSAEINLWTTVGASGAIYGILLAFGMTFPEERIFIFPLPIPIKAKWFVMIYVAIELFSALSSPGDGVAHTAHLGGMLFGYFMIRYWNRHPGMGYNRNSGWQFFDNMKQNFERRRNNRRSWSKQEESGGTKETDWEYNARKKAKQDEIDQILDKIRKSGYDSLTKEEKQKLFDNSNDD
jgi:membrane associated rhomboid family serine protease